jgi:uncharacterized protein YxjI
MKYPINLSFKILALASQIYIRDADNALLGYVKQKMFKLKEDINVFADEQQTQHLYNIKADRILDFSANYRFSEAGGATIGSIKRKGMRSIFKAHYLISDSSGNQVMEIREENGWIKVVDALIGELPIIGMFTGYFFNPSYIVSRSETDQVARLAKEAAFFEGKFQLTPIGQMTEDEEALVLLSVLTMTLMERSRG